MSFLQLLQKCGFCFYFVSELLKSVCCSPESVPSHLFKEEQLQHLTPAAGIHESHCPGVGFSVRSDLPLTPDG